MIYCCDLYDACNTVPRLARLSCELSSSILKALHHGRSVKVSRYFMKLVPCSEIPTSRKESLTPSMIRCEFLSRIYCIRKAKNVSLVEIEKEKKKNLNFNIHLSQTNI